MPMTAKQMIKLLEKNGFVHVKSNAGSHQKYHNKETNKTVSVPVHPGDLNKFTEKTILIQAGLKGARK